METKLNILSSDADERDPEKSNFGGHKKNKNILSFVKSTNPKTVPFNTCHFCEYRLSFNTQHYKLK